MGAQRTLRRFIRSIVEGDAVAHEELVHQVWAWYHSSRAHGDAVALLRAAGPSREELRERAIRYVRREGGSLYRGARLDADGLSYRTGPLESFTASSSIARRFALHGLRSDQVAVMIEFDVDELADRIVLAVPDVIGDAYAQEIEEFGEEGDEKEVLVAGPIVVDAQHITVLS